MRVPLMRWIERNKSEKSGTRTASSPGEFCSRHYKTVIEYIDG
jgi:hypothetical protein